MSKTDKVMSDRDFQQTLKLSFNDVDASVTTNGFLIAKVGRKVEISYPVLPPPGVTGTVVVYTFLENGVTLYEYTLTYTDISRSTLVSAERTA